MAEEIGVVVHHRGKLNDGSFIPDIDWCWGSTIHSLFFCFFNIQLVSVALDCEVAHQSSVHTVNLILSEADKSRLFLKSALKKVRRTSAAPDSSATYVKVCGWVETQ